MPGQKLLDRSALAGAIVRYNGHREAAGSARKRMRAAGAEIRSVLEQQQLELFEHEAPEGVARAKLSDVSVYVHDAEKIASSLGSWDRAYELGTITAAPKRAVEAALRGHGYSSEHIEELLADEPVRTYKRLRVSLKR